MKSAVSLSEKQLHGSLWNAHIFAEVKQLVHLENKVDASYSLIVKVCVFSFIISGSKEGQYARNLGLDLESHRVKKTLINYNCLDDFTKKAGYNGKVNTTRL